jgi:hypothetical protein
VNPLHRWRASTQIEEHRNADIEIEKGTGKLCLIVGVEGVGYRKFNWRAWDGEDCKAEGEW